MAATKTSTSEEVLTPESAVRICQDVQHMIDINSEHLDRLRTPMATTSELTKQEIRTLEGKLIKHFSKQLATRATLSGQKVCDISAISQYPSLNQWLKVVGITKDSADILESRVNSLDALKDKTDSELNRLLLQARLTSTQRQEDLRRMSKALQNLRKYTDMLLHGNARPGHSLSDVNKLELFWDSWDVSTHPKPISRGYEPPLKLRSTNHAPPHRDDSASPKHDHRSDSDSGWPTTPTTKTIPKVDSPGSSLSSCSSIPPPSPGLTLSPPVLLPWHDRKMTPPTTPPWAAAVLNSSNSSKKENNSNANNSKYPTTPPPGRKHSTGIQKSDCALIKSKSHESELVNRVNQPSARDMAVVQAAASNSQQQNHTSAVESNNGHYQHRSSLSSSGMMIASSSFNATSTTSSTSTRTSCTDMTGTTSSLVISTSYSEVISDHQPQQQTFNSSSGGPEPGPTHKSVFRQKRLQTEPVLESIVGRYHLEHVAGGLGQSPIASPKSPPNPFDPIELGPFAQSTLQVPKSPRTPRSMGHVIRHRFTKTFKPAKCNLCSEYMFNGLKCKECKFRCHRDCELHVPPSCGLPEDLVTFYMNQLSKEGSPILPRLPPSASMSMSASTGVSSIGGDHAFMSRFGGGSSLGGHNPSLHIPAYPDSSSNTSSCNSSTPSSPAVMVTSHPTPPHSASVYHSTRTKFTFPDPPSSMTCFGQKQDSAAASAAAVAYAANNHNKASSPNPVVDSVKSYDSDKTLSGTSGSSGSAGTAYRLDSQDSTASVDDSSNSWMATRQTSISMREWDIPYEELNIGDKIGSGRFSTVHQGQWHGDVAVKILDMENIEDEGTIEAFRLDVATFRKTRHENVILFMGACMNPPKLAIVTSLCKGNTLYTHLHLRKDKFSMNKIVIIAQQIAQGMGYLHHRGIIHKDLKTKNIFLENGRAIITDFGLVNVARRLCARQVGPEFYPKSFAALTESDCMSIPKGWLCYLAPEIMRTLRVQPNEGEDLPFTKASDVYAFGTVWFELLTGEWPWKHQPPETIIWLVGQGMKPTLANLSASRDVKEILVACWTFKAEHRPDFTFLSNSLEKIPKKRLARSPSHPVHLTRSAESAF